MASVTVACPSLEDVYLRHTGRTFEEGTNERPYASPGSAGSAAMRDSSVAMTVRHVRALLREPAWIAITLTTPVIWLLLFGSLFERAVDIPASEAATTPTSSPPVWW